MSQFAADFHGCCQRRDGSGDNGVDAAHGITLVGTLFADLTLDVGTEGTGTGVDCSGTFLASGYVDLAICALRSNPSVTCSCD